MADNAGEEGTVVVPSNRSIILADSRFRKEDVFETPYNFRCDLSGTGIYAKELYYQKLYWNQPLFSHNNTNNEIRFQIKFSMSLQPVQTYVVYVTPFVIFKEYDGNDPLVDGVMAVPKPFSYAANLEYAFNNDVRFLSSNQTLANGTGQVWDAFGAPITIRVRYSAAKGFAIYIPYPANVYSQSIGIRILPCNWISKGHFVHGFGIYDPAQSTNEMSPHTFFAGCIWSDTAPNLLPSRYIVIQSPELNKDRRLISFHNGNFANFINELGIFSINPENSGAYHEISVGDDATVISLRDEYTPQSFRISILNERGEEYRCSDPLGTLLQSSGIPDPLVLQSYLEPYPSAGRGNSTFMDYLVFGYHVFQNGIAKGPVYWDPSIALPPPGGMLGSSLPFKTMAPNTNPAQEINIQHGIYLLVDPQVTSPFPQGVGFDSSSYNTYFPPLSAQPCTVFTWYPTLNLRPQIRWDIFFDQVTAGGPPQPLNTSYLACCMFDVNTFQVIQLTNIIYYPTQNPSAAPGSVTDYNHWVNSWTVNPDYVFPSIPNSQIKVGFSLVWYGYSSNFIGNMIGFMDVAAPPNPKFGIRNTDNTSNIQTAYISPEIEDGAYLFGDPQASALCEEVIHEIAAVLKYN